MPTYEKCPIAINQLAQSILEEYESYLPVASANVKIDFLFARAKRDKDGEPVGDAIRHHGCKALGLCRIIPLKGRVLGRGDVEITLDHDWWDCATEPEQKALLDHELHHIFVVEDKDGVAAMDDIGRPKIKMRPHDAEFGMFAIIAERHGKASQERQIADVLYDRYGQQFWPGLMQMEKAA